jgi:hypothetical protein
MVLVTIQSFPLSGMVTGIDAGELSDTTDACPEGETKMNSYQRSGRQRAARKSNQRENNKMTIAEHLYREAEKIALEQQSRIPVLEAEVKTLEAELAKKKVQAAQIPNERDHDDGRR